MDYILFKYLHFLGIFAVIGAVFAELFMIRSEMTRKDMKLVSQVDGIYGVGAILTVTAGLILWLSDSGKPAEFYQENGLVYWKLTIFTSVGLLSIYPTVFLAKNRLSKKHPDGSEVINVPRLVMYAVRLEMALLLLMPFLASSMALGRKLF